jgi:hypothetical protein
MSMDTAQLPDVCDTAGCEGMALVSVVWPDGVSRGVCLVCAHLAATVAQAMGFKITATRIQGVGLPIGDDRPMAPSLRSLLEID